MYITRKQEQIKNTIMMKQEIKNNELQERQKYVPASVKVIETSVQRVICASGDNSTGFGGDFNDGGSY